MATPIKIDEDSFKVLKGKTVLITGASSGIGLECADYFYGLGCNVAYIGGRKRPPTKVPLDSPRTLLRNIDVSSFEAQNEVFEATVQKFGKIDIVVPNAGVNEPRKQYFNLEKDENGKLKPLNLKVIDVDLKGTAYSIALGIHYMPHGGSIIMMTSLAGYAGVPEMPNYSASKHGKSMLFIKARITNTDTISCDGSSALTCWSVQGEEYCAHPRRTSHYIHSWDVSRSI